MHEPKRALLTEAGSKDSLSPRKKSFTLASKVLPKDFANQVLNHELQIDHGDFNMHTINELVGLYSRAIEYYNGMNDEKYTYFESRIQNLLIRPEVLTLMTSHAKNPAKHAKEEESKKKQEESKSEVE
jgi:hypothetical protein